LRDIILEAVIVAVVDLEIAPAGPDRHLVVDLVIGGRNALPGELGADPEAADVAIKGRAELASERGDDARGDDRIDPGLRDGGDTSIRVP